LILTGGELMSYVEKNSELKDTRMSDEWLEQVSNSKDVSQDGLAFLHKKLSKQGYITGSDAKKWLEIERDEAEKQSTKNRIKNLSHEKGATALLARANKECGSMLNFDIITKGLNLASKSIFNVGKK